MWFQNGKDDPDLTVIRVQPQDIRYWDTKNNRVVSFLKMAASLATGKTMDDGVEGELKAVSYTHLDVYKRQIINKIRTHRRGTQLGTPSMCGIHRKKLFA